jgi:hypothetical protein
MTALATRGELTNFSASFVFINIAGCTFIFAIGQCRLPTASVIRGIVTPAKVGPIVDSRLRGNNGENDAAVHRQIFQPSFVFINIAGCTFISAIAEGRLPIVIVRYPIASIVTPAKVGPIVDSPLRVTRFVSNISWEESPNYQCFHKHRGKKSN